MLGKCIECVNCVNCADIYQCEEIDIEIECPFFKNRKVEGDKMECNMCGKKFSGSHVKIEEDTYCIDCAMKLEKITKDMCSKCSSRGDDIKEDKLKVGDVVELKSGSPIMTITCIDENIAKCDYYVFFVKHTTHLHVECLEKVEVE